MLRDGWNSPNHSFKRNPLRSPSAPSGFKGVGLIQAIDPMIITIGSRPATYDRLLANIRLKNIGERAKCLNIGIGRSHGHVPSTVTGQPFTRSTSAALPEENLWWQGT